MKPGSAVLTVRRTLGELWAFRVEWQPEKDTRLTVAGVRETNHEAEDAASRWISAVGCPAPRRYRPKGSA